MVVRNVLADVSKSRVNRAGEILRKHAEGELELDSEELAEQRDIVREFRVLHGRPMQAVAENLRYYVREQSDLMIIGKRLKRVPTIIDKLTRHPDMNLARMHDIGGCRAVLVSETEVRSVAARLEKIGTWRMIHTTTSAIQRRMATAPSIWSSAGKAAESRFSYEPSLSTHGPS